MTFRQSGPALLFVLALTAIPYVPSLGNQFTNWDDDKYVVSNSGIRTLAVGAHFAEVLEGNYHPLTMLSLSIDYAIGELNPFGYHLTNLGLHLLDTALVFWLVWLLTEAPSFSGLHPERRTVALVAALLFGVHTMHVESVIWIAERKDVLYSAFFLSSLIAYVKYLRQRRTIFLVSALLLFVCALLSKAMAVSLAVTLFAIDYLFQRRPSRTVVIEKIPFLVLAVAFGLVAVIAQKNQGAVVPEGYLPLYQRLLIASYGFVQYLGKLALPIDLSPFYAYPVRVNGRLPAMFWVYPVVLTTAAAACAALGASRRVVVFCAVFFALNVALVLQFFPVGSAAMADRYVYVASVGFFALCGIAYSRLSTGRFRSFATIFLAAYVGFLMVGTYRYAATWKDSLTLWNLVISRDPASPLPYYNRGSALLELGRHQDALRDLSRAIDFNPRYAEAFHNRGAAKKGLGDYDGALADFRQALAINPRYNDAHINVGNLLVTLGDFAGAVTEYSDVIAAGAGEATLSDVRVKRSIARYLARDYAGSIDDLDSLPIARVREVFVALADVDLRTNREACGTWNSAAQRGSIAAREYTAAHCATLK